MQIWPESPQMALRISEHFSWVCLPVVAPSLGACYMDSSGSHLMNEVLACVPRPEALLDQDLLDQILSDGTQWQMCSVISTAYSRRVV